MSIDVMQTLKAYRSALIEVDVIQLQIDRLQTIGASHGIRSLAPHLERVPDDRLTPAERRAGVPVFVPSPKGTNNPNAKRRQELDEAERRLAEAQMRVAQVMQDFEMLLLALQDPDERLLIRLRYSSEKAPAEIANIMNVSIATFYRIHASAIRKLQLKYGDK